MNRLASTLVFVLCLASFAAAQITWPAPTAVAFVKPQPQYYAFTFTSTTNYLPSQLYLNYTVGPNCTQPVIPAQGCGACSAGTGGPTFTFSCNCTTIDLSTVTSTTDRCSLTVNLYENVTSTSASNLVGYLYVGTPTVLAVTVVGGSTWIDPQSQTETFIRFSGLNLGTSTNAPSISVDLVQYGTTNPCSVSSLTLSNITVVSAMEVLASIGIPNNVISGVDGCELRVTAFNRQPAPGVTGALGAANRLLIALKPTVTDFPPLARIDTEALDVNVFLTGVNMPLDADQATDKATFSFSGSSQCTSASISGLTLTTATRTQYSGYVTIGSGSVNNCQMTVVFRRFGFAFPAINVGIVADVFFPAISEPSLIAAGAGLWKVVIPTVRDLNPSANPFFFTWNLWNAGTLSTCAPAGTVPSGNSSFSGCLNTAFGSTSVNCTIAVNLAADGCVLEAVFNRGSLTSNPLQVGLLSSAPIAIAPRSANNYFPVDASQFDLSFVVGRPGIGGSISNVNGVSLDIVGDGSCSGSATGTFSQVCDISQDISRSGDGSATITCIVSASRLGGVTPPNTDTICNFILTISTPVYNTVNTTIGSVVATSPVVTGPSYLTNGFTGDGVLLKITGTDLPLASEGYSIVVQSDPPNCFTPLPTVAAGLCMSGGPSSIDRTAFDCLINGTFTQDDPCVLSFRVFRFNSTNLASGVVNVATRLIAVPSIATSGSGVRTVTAGASTSVNLVVAGLPQTPPTQTTVKAFCGSTVADCSITSEGVINSTHTDLSCNINFAAPEFDTCLVQFAVFRFGLSGPRYPLFRVYYIPVVNPGSSIVAASNFTAYNLTLSGSNFPRPDEQVSASITLQCISLTTPCNSIIIARSGASLICVIDIPAVSNGCPVYATVTRFGGTSNLVQVGFVSTDPFALAQSPLVGLDVFGRAPFVLPLKGYNWNLLAGRAINLRYYQPCYGTTGGVNYATCDAVSTYDVSTIYCNVTTAQVITSTNVTSRWGCPVRIQIGTAAISLQPLYFRLVTAPVLNSQDLVLIAGEPTVVDITGLYLPPATNIGDVAGSTENIVVTLTSAKSGCDMSQAPVSSITQVMTTLMRVTITPSSSLNDCPFNVTVIRHGFASNTVSFGKVGARSVVADPSTQRGIPLGDSVLSIPLLYPPGPTESVDVLFEFASCSATPPVCVDPRMSGDSVLCNVTIPADAHNCVLKASIDRNNFGFGASSNVGVTIRRPTVAPATGSIRAITPTQITINGTDLPAASDVRAVTFQAAGTNCVGTITCGSPVYSPPSSVTCTINAPLTLRGCTISASVSRFAVASAFADLFTVIDPVYSPLNVSFLFEGDYIPTQDTYTNISLGFAESLQVVGGVTTIPITPTKKRAVSTVYGAITTFSTYDAVAGANRMRTDATLRTLLLNSIFLYTRQQFAGIPDFLFDGALPPLSPTPPPTVAPVASNTPGSSLAPQGSSSASSGLDAGGIAAIAVVVSIVAIVAIVIVVLVATGRIGGPVPKPPPKQSKATKMSDAPPAGTAASGGAESSSSASEGSGEESSGPSNSGYPDGEEAPAAPAAGPLPANEEETSSGSGSEEASASADEESSSEEGSDESSSSE
eukprot:TRINITY_DN8131_c0_g1_i1.p1 TRINITY_DN8131_c0_g1~~TRINITY_DN8131_c0_g1_i1.p1  ORF type:complete len:1601 (-),score=330.46 TRINITY_DN8131_c0_g1_i1:63-4865(-)